MTIKPLDSETEPGATADPPVGLDRLRVLAALAMGTVLVTYAMLVPAASATVQSGGRDLTLDGAFAAAVPLWLAAHQVSMVIGGQPLTVLPLLPTIAVVVVVALGSGAAMRRLGGRVTTDGGAVLATVTGAHAAVAVLGSALLPPEVAAGPWTAMVAAGSVAAFAVGVGVLRAVGNEWHGLLVRPARPAWLLPAIHGAAVGVTGLLAVGSATLLLGAAIAAPDVQAAYGRIAPDAAAAVGVTLLAFAYLPNAVVAALSWALGPGVGLGLAVASPFAAAAADEPSSFPLLAVLPAAAPPAAMGVFALPVAAGILVGRACVRASGPDAPVWPRVTAAAVASGVTALTVGLLALLAGGRLATGAYDPVNLPAGLLVVAVLAWVGVPAMLAAALRPFAHPRAAGRAVEAIRARRAGTVAAPVVPAQRGLLTVAELVAQRARATEQESTAAPTTQAEPTAQPEPEPGEGRADKPS